MDLQFIHTLNQNLRDKIPLLILVNFILFLILLYLNRKELKAFFKKIKTKTWIILLLIFLLALGLRLFVSPHLNKMLYDEAWYMETANRLIETNFLSQGNYFKGIGWPFVLAPFFKVFDISNWTALYTSSVLGALTVFNIFFLALLLLKKESVALWSSFLFSLMPLHIIWSGSADVGVPSLFFITLGLFFSFLYFKRKTLSLLFLSLISLSFVSQFRQENYLYFLLFFLGLIIFNKISFRKIIHFKLNYHKLETIFIWIFLILLIILLTGPNLVQMAKFQLSTNWTSHESGGKFSNQNWSLANLAYNIPGWGIHIFTNKYHPFVFTALFIAGIIYLFTRKRREMFFLLIWFFSLFLIYFSSWRTLGGKSRFLVSFYPITTIFAGVSINLAYKKLSRKVNPKKLAIIFASILLLLFSLAIKEGEGDDFYEISGKMQVKLETKIPEMAEKEIPSNCIIVANVPEMISATTNLQVMQLGDFLNSKSQNKTDCLLFFEDFTCEILLPSFPAYIKNCQEIKKKYELVPYLSYSEKETFAQLKAFIQPDSPFSLDSPFGTIEVIGYKNNNAYLIERQYIFNKSTKEFIEQARILKEKYNIKIFSTSFESWELIKQANEEGLAILPPLEKTNQKNNLFSTKSPIEITKSYTFYKLYPKKHADNLRLE